MSQRSLFARILRISCWIADLLLVSLGIYLALRNQDTLTVQTALALGLCVALGGVLPLAVYFVDYLFAVNERRGEEARGPETLRDAMQRLEQLTRRVEDASESATKATLVARQVPDRVEEKLGILQEAAAGLRPESLENVAVGIEQLNNRLGSLAKDWEALKHSLQEASSDDSAILQQIGDQLPALARLLEAGPTSAGDSQASSEAMDTRFEAVDRRMADLVAEIKGMGAALHEVVSGDAEELRKLGERLAALEVAVKSENGEEDAVGAAQREAFEQLREAIETQGLLRDEKLEELIDRLNALEAQWAETEWQTVADEDEADADSDDDEEGEAVSLEESDDSGTGKDPDTAVDEAASETISTPVADPIVEEIEAETELEEVIEVPAEPESDVDETDLGEDENLHDDWVEEPAEEEVSFLEDEGETETVEFSDEDDLEDFGDDEEFVAEAEDAMDEVIEVVEDGVDADSETDALPDESEEESEPVAPPAPPAPRKSAKARRAEQEMQLFDGDAFEAKPPSPKVAPGHCLVVAKAIIGISNKLFLRGDDPLSWDTGTPLQMTGIGEYRLELDGLEGPIECEVRLNDELSALGGTIRLEPGQAITVTPHFPR